MAIPALERHCGSWVVARQGVAIFETFDRSTAEEADELGFEVHTAAQWLGRLNREIRDARA